MKVEQCKTCPWRKDSKCSDIPNYDIELHKSLKETIAGSDGNLSKVNQILKAMSCHYSLDENNNIYCVGWLNNQLGVGNNIQLRFAMRKNNISDVIVDGEQVNKFQDTFK